MINRKSAPSAVWKTEPPLEFRVFSRHPLRNSLTCVASRGRVFHHSRSRFGVIADQITPLCTKIALAFNGCGRRKRATATPCTGSPNQGEGMVGKNRYIYVHELTIPEDCRRF